MNAQITLIWCLLLMAGTTAARADADGFRKFLADSRDQFKEVELRRGTPPFSVIHDLAPATKPVEFEGKFFTGFRFMMPEWLDGPLVWLFTIPGPEAEVDRAKPGYRWFLVPEEGSAKITIQGSRYYNKTFPKFRELFPGCESFTQQFIYQEGLVPGKRHLMWFSFPTREIPPIRFALTVWSPRGQAELGMLPTGFPAGGPGPAFRTIMDREPKPAEQIRDAAIDTFKTAGCAAALQLLDRESDDFIHCGGTYSDLHVALWFEALTGNGHEHPEWGAALFEWLQQQAIKWDAVALAEDVGGNACAALLAVNRVGAARKALQPFEIGMRRLQVDLDPKTYEDAGPALPALPEIRLRRTPLVGKRWLTSVTVAGSVTLDNTMNRKFPQSMGCLGALEWIGGDWQRALEREFWLQDWVKRSSASDPETKGSVFESQLTIGEILRSLGLLEAADAAYRAVVEAEEADPYEGRSQIFAKQERLGIRIALGDADEPMLQELAHLREEIDKGHTSHLRAREDIDVTRARALAALGHFEEADDLLGKLVAGGHPHARLERLRLRLAARKFTGLENEMLLVLSECRESGRKIDEAELYSLYADLLEAGGRLNEALTIRKEALRLARSFDLFTRTPVELAKLSVLLAKCRNTAGAKTAAAEATRLATRDERIPPRIAAAVAAVLATAPATPSPAPPAGPAPLADLQPVRAVAAPIAGLPLRGQLTLTNPSAQAVEGVLAFQGPPVAVTWDADSQVARAVVGGEDKPNRIAPLRVAPGTFARIVLLGTPQFVASGQLVVSWKVPGRAPQESRWTLDPPEEGVSAVVIEAGEFRRNPFHAVPIFHHYQHAVAGTPYAKIRAVAAAPARIEIYDATDHPVAVDANGNGSLVDAGDSVFMDPDFDGVAALPLDHGEAALRLQVFPRDPMPKDGLEVTIEALLDGAWVAVAHDRIVP